MRGTQLRGLESLLTIWGTPDWANGGKGANYAPTRLSDLTGFARALASRYSGRNAGYPFVRFYSVWNEPNLEQFLAPTFDKKGKPVSPLNYAKLYRAAYTGLKGGSPGAQIGIGETSPARPRQAVAGPDSGLDRAGDVREAAVHVEAQGEIRRLCASPLLRARRRARCRRRATRMSTSHS